MVSASRWCMASSTIVRAAPSRTDGWSLAASRSSNVSTARAVSARTRVMPSSNAARRAASRSARNSSSKRRSDDSAGCTSARSARRTAMRTGNGHRTHVSGPLGGPMPAAASARAEASEDQSECAPGGARPHPWSPYDARPPLKAVSPAAVHAWSRRPGRCSRAAISGSSQRLEHRETEESVCQTNRRAKAVWYDSTTGLSPLRGTTRAVR
jgi:hypothetical protein